MLETLLNKLNVLFNEHSDSGIKSQNISEELLKEVLSRYSLSDLLPYYYYDEEYQIFINKHSCGFIFETTPLLGSNEEIERRLLGLFKDTLPVGSNLQFLLIASPKVGKDLEFWRSKRDNSSPVLKELANKRVNYLASLAYEPSKIRNYRLVISYSKHVTYELSAKEKKQIKYLADQLIITFKGFGLPVIKWDGNHLLSCLADILNLKKDIFPSNIKWNPHQDLSSQIVKSDTSIQLYKDDISVNEGEFIVRAYSVEELPEVCYLHEMGELLGDNFNDLLQIRCPFMISFAVHIINDNSQKTKLSAKGARIESQAGTVLAKFMPSLIKEAAEYKHLRELLERNEKLVRCHFQIALFSNPTSIAHDEQSLYSLYTSKNWKLIRDKFIKLPSLYSMLPMSWGEGMEYDMVTQKKATISVTEKIIQTLPMQGEWMGTKTPGMIMLGRRGQVFYWNPFDNNAGNFNVCVSGNSGSGKSVFMQELVTSTLGLGGKVFVLDVGRSFKKMSTLLGGDFIEFSLKESNKRVCLNPFSTIVGKDRESILESLSMLKSIIALMAAPKEEVSNLGYSLIQQAIIKVWEDKGNKAGIGDIARWLRSHEKEEAQNIGTILFPYTEEGIHGRYFNGEANITFEKDLNVIEFEDLKEQKELQAVVLQIFIIQITNKMFLGDRITPYNIVIDEAWDMLKDERSGEFIETLARRLRKYNGSLVTGTQSIDDFYETPSAQAAFNNSDWVCMLAQKSSSIELLEKSKKFTIDAHMKRMLKSVTTKHGEYGEIMITNNNGYAIGRLILDPFSKVLYSTTAEEYTAVKKLEAEGKSLEQAISIIAEQKYGL